MPYKTQMLYWTIAHPFFVGNRLSSSKNMCLLDWVCRLLRKYKLSFSFKAATPCSINI